MRFLEIRGVFEKVDPSQYEEIGLSETQIRRVGEMRTSSCLENILARERQGGRRVAKRSVLESVNRAKIKVERFISRGDVAAPIGTGTDGSEE